MNGQSVLANAAGTTTTYEQLCQWMKEGDDVIVTDHNGKGYCGTINAIEREDGSGRCWNVHLYCAGIRLTAFIRTK